MFVHPSTLLTYAATDRGLVRVLVAVHSLRHARALVRIRRVAASLPRSVGTYWQSPERAEAPSIAVDEASLTARHRLATEVRAAGAQ